jgi:hypothetical protein
MSRPPHPGREKFVMRALAHRVTAEHYLPLRPDCKVFGSAEKGYYILTPFANGSRWCMKADNGFAVQIGWLESILACDAAKMEADPTQWQLACKIWPDHYVVVELVSPCCSSTIDISRGDGVSIGSCSNCKKSVVRTNPQTGIQEWPDGELVWTSEQLGHVVIED